MRYYIYVFRRIKTGLTKAYCLLFISFFPWENVCICANSVLSHDLSMVLFPYLWHIYHINDFV